MRTIKGYGWKRQLPDRRDRIWHAKAEPLPVKADLRNANMPPVYDQGELGSCTANAIAAAFDYEHSSQGLGFLSPSRLFIYANERLLEGTSLSEDSGAEIRDGVKTLSQLGVCAEDLWPYDVTQFSVKPPQGCYDAATHDLVLQYQSVTQGIAVRYAIAQGFPVIFGFSVYDSFESESVAQSGIVPMPGINEPIVGGHAVVAVGYDLTEGVYIVRNSWGQWGQSGYCTMPIEYLDSPDLASDFWCLQRVE